MPTLELEFPLVGTEPIAADHGYHLYSALSRIAPAVHSENGVGVHPIRGRQFGDRLLSLQDFSRLLVRTPESHIAPLVRLAGKRLRVADAAIRVGVPRVRALLPAPALRSRLVTIKLPELANESDGEAARSLFVDAVRRKLDGLGISEHAIVTLGKRRTLRIKDKEVVGYETMIDDLTAEESLALQENGDPTNPHAGFSRRHMGCAMFAPTKMGEE